MAVQAVSYVCTAYPEVVVAKRGVVRKNLRLTQSKIDKAKRILGTKTETETIEQALDLVVFRQEVLEGISRIAGTGSIRDIFTDDEAA
jgi:hypothetical protein